MNETSGDIAFEEEEERDLLVAWGGYCESTKVVRSIP